MNRKRVFGTALLVAMSVAGAFTFFGTQSTEALPTNEVEIFWLDESGAVVGSRFRGCNGERYSDGVQTNKIMTYTAACTNPSPHVLCQWDGSQVSCAIPLFIDACVPHFGEELCAFP